MPRLMLMDEYSIKFADGWDKHFSKFDKSVQQRIARKIAQLKQPLKHRHLKHGLPFFVEEVGGYRIAFETDEDGKTKTVQFVGNHKQYQEWHSQK